MGLNFSYRSSDQHVSPTGGRAGAAIVDLFCLYRRSLSGDAGDESFQLMRLAPSCVSLPHAQAICAGGRGTLCKCITGIFDATRLPLHRHHTLPPRLHPPPGSSPPSYSNRVTLSRLEKRHESTQGKRGKWHLKPVNTRRVKR